MIRERLEPYVRARPEDYVDDRFAGAFAREVIRQREEEKAQ